MRRYLSALLALILLCGTVFPAVHAEDLLSGLSGLTGLLGSILGEETEDPSALPELKKEYSGEKVKVKLSGTTIKVHADFKEVMDEYERFFDEYVLLMQQEDPDMLQLSSFLLRYAEAMQALASLEETELDEGDMLYYSDVMLRISAKLLTMEE